MQQTQVSIKEGQFENVLAVAFAPVVALSELIKNSSDACIFKRDIIKIYINTTKNTISLKDNGYGFSSRDIDNLKTVGYSTKMTEGNLLSKIGEPFAGSKGLGILTAFNLCETLEVLTFSEEDKKAYKVLWKKGTAQIFTEEIDRNIKGTELILHDVSDETIQLLIMEEELAKLYLSSITYYKDSQTLPQIELYKNEEKKVLTPKNKIENLYNKFKKTNSSGGYFVAKASFRYSNNKLTLSYEDNDKRLYVFEDEEIDLTDFSTILEFLRKNKIPNARLRQTFNNFDTKTYVDDFEGIYYIWRNRKPEEVDYPYGVRVYINNYGLYNYLNKDFDWLQHSEISQNVKATNYKLKNTFGYVTFKKFNEETSGLKISNERNDFHENMSKKKFFYIMQKFVSGIFSTIDISVKNFDKAELIKFDEKVKNKTIVIGSLLNVSDLISTNLSLEEINIVSPDGVSIDTEGGISFLKPGRYPFSFEYDENKISVEVLVEENVPLFELKRTTLTVNENNFKDLSEEIKSSSTKNLNPEDIRIYSNDNADISKDKIFTSKNLPGSYRIIYEYSGDLTRTMLLTVRPIHSIKADKIKNLFPNVCCRYPKITDIITGISESYVRHPALCIISIRPLIEISLKAFIDEFYSQEEKDKIKKESEFNVRGKLSGFMNKIRNKQLLNVDNTIFNRYSGGLIETGKQIEKCYDNLGLNSYIHSQHTHPTSSEVSQSMKKFQHFLNFIIDAINAKNTTS